MIYKSYQYLFNILSSRFITKQTKILCVETNLFIKQHYSNGTLETEVSDDAGMREK